MKKLSMLLTLVLVLTSFGALFTVGTSAADVDVWDGTTDISWYDPDEISFLITTPEQLAGMAELGAMGVTFEGQYFYLGADIYLNEGEAATWTTKRTDENDPTTPFAEAVVPANKWTPICNIMGFAGTFDGQGHTISGLYYFGAESSDSNIGLFGIVAGTSEDSLAVIKNVSIVNSYVDGYMNVGSIAGYIDAFVTIEGCYSDAYCRTNWYDTKNAGSAHGCAVSFCGGIAGAISGTPLDITFNNCWFAGEVYAFSGNNFGGIVGGNSSGQDMDCNFKITNCAVTGSVIGDQRIGGIIGRYACGGPITIENCYVNATIQYLRTGNYGATIGGLRGKASTHAIINNVYFDGTFLDTKGSPAGARLGAFEDDSSSVYGYAETAVYYTPLDDKSAQPCSNDKRVVESEGVLVANGTTLDPFVAALDTNLWATKDGVPVLKTLTTAPGTVAPTTTLPEGAETAPVEPETTPAPETTAAPETTVAPEETTAAPEETTAAPEETTAAPEETTAAPEETTAAPEETTAAPEDTTPADTTPAEEGGCGSFIGGSIVVATAILGTAWVSKRR